MRFFPTAEDLFCWQIAYALKDDSQMANESAMRERGWPEPRRQQRHTHAGENHRMARHRALAGVG